MSRLTTRSSLFPTMRRGRGANCDKGGPPVLSQIDRLLHLYGMTTGSVALFAHLLGVVTLFAALAIEWISLELLRTAPDSGPPHFLLRVLAALPRFTGIAAVLILLSGFYLGAQLRVFGFAWIRISLAGLVVMAVLGGTALRPLLRRIKAGRTVTGDGYLEAYASNVFVRSSLRIRLSVAVAIVYLMVVKPDLLESTLWMVVAVGVGVVWGLVGRRSVAAAPAV